MYTSLSNIRPCKKADLMSVVLNCHCFRLVVISRNLRDFDWTVGESERTLLSSSKPRAVSLALILPSFSVKTQVVEPKPINDALRFRDAKESWSRIAGLRPWGDGAYLNKPESEAAQCVDKLRIFIKACGKANGVRELQPSNTSYRRRQGAGPRKKPGAPAAKPV